MVALIVWSALGWTSKLCPAPPEPTKMEPPVPMVAPLEPEPEEAPPVPFVVSPLDPPPPPAAKLAAATRAAPRPKPKVEMRLSIVERYSYVKEKIKRVYRRAEKQ